MPDPARLRLRRADGGRGARRPAERGGLEADGEGRHQDGDGASANGSTGSLFSLAVLAPCLPRAKAHQTTQALWQERPSEEERWRGLRIPTRVGSDAAFHKTFLNLPVGRVQTGTYAILVQRSKEVMKPMGKAVIKTLARKAKHKGLEW